MAGVHVPLHACEHFYVVTEAMAGLPRHAPVLRVPDEHTYFKEDAGKMLVGFFEPKAKPWAVDGIPDDFEFGALPDDWEQIAPELELATKRVPTLSRTGIHTFFNGPESFTPDDRYLLGEAPNLRNFFVAEAKRRPCAISSSLPASTRSAFNRQAAPARRSPSG